MRWLKIAFLLSFIGVVLLVGYCTTQLPSVDSLLDVRLQAPTRLLSQEGALIAEIGDTRRIPITIDQVPKPLIEAILATEDRRFYQHPGVDMRGLVRSTAHLVRHRNKGQGASTITMQVARNFFLTRQKTFSRKLTEVLLAFKIERHLSKDKILELYLNKIYFGKSAYGIAAAAEVYFGCTIDELSIAQMALLAGLPQAPSAINPVNNPKGALTRRNHVLSRMHHYHFIDDATYERAIAEPLNAGYYPAQSTVHAPYFTEHVRQQLIQKYGERVYTEGWIVYSTLNEKHQHAANAALQGKLLAYDKRHGFRGAVGHFEAPTEDHNTLAHWQERLHAFPKMGSLTPGVIVASTETEILALDRQGALLSINEAESQWVCAKTAKNCTAHTMANIGDVFYFEATKNNQWIISQVPQANAALVSLVPDTGAISSMVGGFDFNVSHFNRVTQALRQSGSNFKPFIYTAALEQGYTTASIFNDAPFTLYDPESQTTWIPRNDDRTFTGLTRMRTALVRSRNIISVRILDSINLDKTLQTLEQFGFGTKKLPHTLSLALGAGLSTPLEIARGYAVFANGGYRITPFGIHHIETTRGEIIYKNPTEYVLNGQDDPFISSYPLPHAPRAVPATISYIVYHMLKDVIQQGTGQRAKVLKRNDLAGKTGTSNDEVDAWFSGFNRELVCVTWMGYDDPRSLKEFSASSALPMWIDFMRIALAGTPESNLPQPPGLINVRIDPKTGLLAHPQQKNAIFELFTPETVPKKVAPNPNTGSSGRPAEDTELIELLY
ncbi:MAG: PBP1A family penicillin-binding protein [Pseudomonadota bacterium]